MKNVSEFRWFCYHNLTEVSSQSDIKISEIEYNPMFIKEGSIMFLWDFRKKYTLFIKIQIIHYNFREYFRGTKDLLEKFDYRLVIVVDKAEKACGTFYIDDGRTFDNINVKYFHIFIYIFFELERIIHIF